MYLLKTQKDFAILLRIKRDHISLQIFAYDQHMLMVELKTKITISMIFHLELKYKQISSSFVNK